MFSPLRSFAPKLLLLSAALCLTGSVAAQPRVDDERAEIVRQLRESRERVRKLEERLRLIEARRAQSAAVPSSVAAQPENSCSIPFFLDQDGVKHFRPECLLAAARAACQTNPFTIDDQGIKRIRPACSENMSSR